MLNKIKTAIVIAGAVTAIGGALHAPFARGLLQKIGGCPVGKASAADIESVRKQAATQMRGNASDIASVRKPFGTFTMESTTRDDVRAWATNHGVQCAEKREGMLLICANVAASALEDRDSNDGALEEISFSFRPSDSKLVNVSAMSFGLSPADAAGRATRNMDRLAAHIGAPSETNGEFTADRLGRGGFITSTASYRYTNYIAEVTATGFGPRGVTLREHYVVAD